MKAQASLEAKKTEDAHRRELEKMRLEAELYSSWAYVNKRMIELQEEQVKAQTKSADSVWYLETSAQVRDWIETVWFVLSLFSE